MADRWSDYNRTVIAEFRANDGEVGGQLAGLPVVILTTTGAKSGQPREVPLVYDRDGDRLVVIGSKGGAPTDPDWCHNLRAHPRVTVDLASETFRGRAVEVTGKERERLFRAMAAWAPNVGEYQRRNDRRFPVFVIERAV